MKRTTKQTKQAHIVDDDDARTVHKQPRVSSFPLFTFIYAIYSCCIYYLLLFCITINIRCCSVAKAAAKDDDAANLMCCCCVIYYYTCCVACFIHLYYSLFLGDILVALMLSLWTLVTVEVKVTKDAPINELITITPSVEIEFL